MSGLPFSLGFEGGILRQVLSAGANDRWHGVEEVKPFAIGESLLHEGAAPVEGSLRNLDQALGVEVALQLEVLQLVLEADQGAQVAAVAGKAVLR